jgi:prepilin-type N-terminal cleavage/methylation domain-containing protein
MRRRQLRFSSRPGFSIIELVIVLIMVSLIAGMAVPRLNYEKFRADAAMRTVRTIMQGAQRSAIMRQTNVVVGFDEPGKQIQILEDTDNDCVLDSGERLSKRPLEEGTQFKPPPLPFGASAPNGVNGTALCTMNGLPAIQFLRDGATSTDLEVYVTSSRGSKTDFRLILVTQASGRSDAYRFDGSAWVRTN